jgi:hypothetical protein
MKSAFGSKRKARKIQVDEDDEGGANDTHIDTGAVNTRKSPKTTATNPADHRRIQLTKFVASATLSTSSNLGRKAFKKSSLRQSIAFDDQDGAENFENSSNGEQTTNKPSISRSSSLKKRKPAASRLSFGPGEIISGDAAEALEDEAFTPKKSTLGRRVIEHNAVRKSLSLPMRVGDDDEVRPTYNKDYLNELKSSTPSTNELQSRHAMVDDDGGLDASELDGAMIVDLDPRAAEISPAHIPSEAEIREKKERRSRLAHEQDYISLDSSPSDFRQLSLLPQKKKTESRLVREDEDLMENFDEFVDDGRISLGKKQEREARRRQRKEMADMIHKAEGSSDDESDDSEAERRAAYEAAQTRAGMDGLHKPNDEKDLDTVQIPAKITPLPVLPDCLDRLQDTLRSMELELSKKRRKIEEARQEKLEIAAREVEVQELLKQAGAKYAALKADTNGAVADPNGIPMIADRGLESFGNTPVVRPDVEDMG